MFWNDEKLDFPKLVVNMILTSETSYNKTMNYTDMRIAANTLAYLK